ncbi:GspE/PulE family protein [Thermodesulfobacteriota bacterium]
MGQDQDRKIEAFVELDHFIIDALSVQMLSYKFCSQNFVVILNAADPESTEPITVGMLDPFQHELVEQLEKNLERPVNAVRLNAYEIQKAIDKGFGLCEEEEEELKLCLKTTPQVSFEPDLSATELIDDLLGRALTVGASDVHVECYRHDVDVRFRIDGILHQMNTPISTENLPSVISRLKVLSNLDIAERRADQDGRLYAEFESGERAQPVDFRLSVVPGPFGEDAVLRILESEKPLIGLDELGFSAELLEQFRTLINNPEGMILVTGPTGSGKTTTLYAGLQEINTDENKVLTAEDPIEYLFPKTNQKQINPVMDFADYARAFLRQDPDVMLIGEIRDEETAEMALRAAQTGHLVLSTLHTTDSVGTISRLRTLGLDPGLIADTLLGALSQRLVRRICNGCKEEIAPDKFALKLFRQLGYKFPIIQPQGCDECFLTGYYGRTGVYELFIPGPEIADMIYSEIPAHKIRQAARRVGMRSLFEDALDKVKTGITTLSELHRTIPYRIITEPAIDSQKPESPMTIIPDS